MTSEYVERVGRRAKAASRQMGSLSTALKDRCLLAMAQALRESAGLILEKNALDVDKARAKGAPASFIDRLTLTEKRVEEMAKGLEELAALSRSMGMSNDPEVLAFRQQVDRILTMFGAEAFAPAEGEPFDPRRCERFSPDLGREVAECRSPGWACGETVLLRAVVITR